MHEFSLAEGLLKVALDALREEDADCVKAIRMDVGAMSGVDPEALRFAFSALSAGTAAGDAVLEIRPVAITCRCPDCGTTFECEMFDYSCPACGAVSADIVTGREMNVINMEVA